jgi:hypothetical protein
MKGKLRALVIFGAGLGACADSDTAGAPGTVEPPPQDRIFITSDVTVDTDAGGQPITETRYFFDDVLFRSLCVVPDADSFDDYEEIDNATGEVLVPRGERPLSEDCEADGIVTGPMHEELYPSSWCRVEGCLRADAIGEEPSEGGY